MYGEKPLWTRSAALHGKRRSRSSRGSGNWLWPCNRVWYFGEDAFDAGKHGKLTLSPDTWHSGVDGALPGVFMPPNPQLGEQHYQEYYPGHAEDQFQVTSLSARVRVPFRSFKHTLETSETSRLEPGVVERDYYARGVGQVLERAGAGGHTALIRVLHRR